VIERKRLKTGVRLAWERLPGVRTACVGIWVNAGSRDERREELGAAHFLEHMAFKDTKRHTASGLAEAMDAVGGQYNAFTTRETTCFYARVLDTHLDTAIDLLTEMFFESLLREEDIALERGVIGEEIDMYRDTPEDLVVEQLIARCFPGALGRPVLGTRATIARLDQSALRAYRARNYRPERTAVVIAGSFSDAILARLEGIFTVMEREGRAGRGSRWAEYRPADVQRRRATEQDHFCIGWPGIPVRDNRRFAGQVLSTVLGGGMSSRLFQQLREKHGLCYSVGSFTASFAETGILCVSGATNRENEARALALIAEETERFRQEGITQQELDRAREQLKTSMLMAMESTTSRMNRLGAGELQTDRCLEVEEVLERYDAITREDILELARVQLDPARRSHSALGHPLPTDMRTMMDATFS